MPDLSHGARPLARLAPQIADVWTTRIHPEDYAAFLRRLLRDVTKGRHQESYVWKDTRLIKYGGYELEEEEEGNRRRCVRRS